MTATWKINSSEYNTAPNKDGLIEVITAAHYDVLASGARGDIGRVYGSVKFDPPNPANFKPRESVTETEIIAWTKAKLGEDEAARLETASEGALARIVTPERVSITFGPDGEQVEA